MLTTGIPTLDKCIVRLFTQAASGAISHTSFLLMYVNLGRLGATCSLAHPFPLLKLCPRPKLSTTTMEASSQISRHTYLFRYTTSCLVIIHVLHSSDQIYGRRQ
jgi:hypothetical protein